MTQRLEDIARIHPYEVGAYEFVLRGLNFTMENLDELRHVSGAELAAGMRDFALQEFGPIAKHVLNRWGVTTTRDFGEIVFHLVAAGMLRKTDEDSVDDFDDCFDFAQVFETDYYLGRSDQISP